MEHPTWNIIEKKLFRKLNTPTKIQDYLNNLEVNFELKGETCMSPRRVMKESKAHCMEGALFAAASLSFHGQPPFILDLRSQKPDDDHVIALFKAYDCFGAISKTNHAVLRYREPIYKTIRELVLSYFHEYFRNDNGKKTLRDYSKPVNLHRFSHLLWQITEEDLWDIPDYLENTPHTKIMTPAQIKNLRKADPIEIKAGELVQWAVTKRQPKRLV